MKNTLAATDRTADLMLRLILGLNMAFLTSFLAVALFAALHR